MNPTEVERIVVGIVAHQAMVSPDTVRLNSTPEEMGLDSLGLVESIFAIEEAFDVTVPFNANDPRGASFDISSIGSIVTAVQALIAAKTA